MKNKYGDGRIIITLHSKISFEWHEMISQNSTVTKKKNKRFNKVEMQ